jgi:hypothetical protein
MAISGWQFDFTFVRPCWLKQLKDSKWSMYIYATRRISFTVVPTGATLPAAVVSDAVVVGATVPVVCLGNDRVAQTKWVMSASCHCATTRRNNQIKKYCNVLRHDHEFYLAVPRACFGVALFRAAVVVGSAETNEGNPIQAAPMVV